MNGDAKQVGGVWLPASEQHLPGWMLRDHKHARTIDGLATYQHHKLSAALEHVPADRRGLALDVGAHVGLWSMWLQCEFETLHAFEPVPEHCELWHRNVGLVSGLGIAWLHRVACGALHGTVEIDIEPSSTGNSHVVSRDGQQLAAPTPAAKGGRQVLVEQHPLDGFALEGVDFIKVDVEGYELEVLRGALTILERDRPVVCVEAKGYEHSYYRGPRREAVTFLENLGMRTAQVLSGDYIMVWP